MAQILCVAVCLICTDDLCRPKQNLQAPFTLQLKGDILFPQIGSFALQIGASRAPVSVHG